jgi:hypothetical protein
VRAAPARAPLCLPWRPTAFLKGAAGRAGRGSSSPSCVEESELEQGLGGTVLYVSVWRLPYDTSYFPLPLPPCPFLSGAVPSPAPWSTARSHIRFLTAHPPLIRLVLAMRQRCPPGRLWHDQRDPLSCDARPGTSVLDGVSPARGNLPLPEIAPSPACQASQPVSQPAQFLPLPLSCVKCLCRSAWEKPALLEPDRRGPRRRLRQGSSRTA